MTKKIFWIFIRRFTMIFVPFVLVGLESFHPSGFSQNVYAGLHSHSSWWTNLHIAQSFLFGAAAIGAIFLTLGVNTLWGTLSKILIWLFAVSYLVFDSTAGIAVGFIMNTYKENPEFDLQTIQKILNLLYNDPIIGGKGSFFSLTGSWSWLIGILSAVIALFLENAILPFWKLLPPLALLCLSAYTLWIGHYAPFGPIAFGSFALAVLWMEIFHFGPSKRIECLL